MSPRVARLGLLLLVVGLGFVLKDFMSQTAGWICISSGKYLSKVYVFVRLLPSGWDQWWIQDFTGGSGKRDYGRRSVAPSPGGE